MGLRARYNAITERFKDAQEKYKQGSFREAISALRRDPYSLQGDGLAPSPATASCKNHPRRKQTFAGLLIDLIVVPAVFAGWWKQIVLEPDYVFPGAEPGPVLQHPHTYGLDAFEEKPITFYKTDKKTGKQLPTRQMMTWYAEAAPGFPTFVYCHGSTGSLDARGIVLQELHAAGFGVVIGPYPGYKGNKEDFSGKKLEATERGFIGTAKSMYNMVREELARRKRENPDTDISTDIIMFGESMGCAVAMKAAREIELGDSYHNVPPQKVAAAVCFAAFRSLPERVREAYPLLPASRLMGIQLNAESVIAKIKAPVVLLHGTADEVTCHHHSLSLQKAGGNNVEVILLPGANHSLKKQKARDTRTFFLVSETPEDPETLKIDHRQVKYFISYLQGSLAAKKIEHKQADHFITQVQSSLDTENISREEVRELILYVQSSLGSNMLNIDSRTTQNIIACVQSSLDPEIQKVDRLQVRDLVARVQSSLYAKGLCHTPGGDTKWEDAVSLESSLSMAI